MSELVKSFEKANLPDAILVLTGYDDRFGIKPQSTQNVISLMIDDPKDVKNAIVDADCYIMNSSEEGFGLVILESMINNTPWIARNIAGARLLSEYGDVYETDDELVHLLRNFQVDSEKVKRAYTHVVTNHLIENTIDDIAFLMKQ